MNLSRPRTVHASSRFSRNASRKAAAAWLIALVFALSLVAMAASSQQVEPEDVSHSYLYLQAEEVGSRQTHPVCGELPVYGLSKDAPREHLATQIPGRSDHCLVFFSYQVEDAFTLKSGDAFTFWLGCDAPLWFGASRSETDLHVRFERNGEWLGLALGSAPQAYLCSSDMESIRMDAVYENYPTFRFQPGDELSLILFLHHENVDPFGNVQYIAVESKDHPSAVHGVGYPGKMRADLRSELLVEAPLRAAEAGPGRAAIYPATLHNLADEDRDVRVLASGDAGWTPVARPPVVTVPAGGTAEVEVAIRAPEDAPEGAHAVHMISFEPEDEGPVRYEATTYVVEGEGSAWEAEVGEAVWPQGVLLVALAVAMGLFVSRRRVR